VRVQEFQEVRYVWTLTRRPGELVGDVVVLLEDVLLERLEFGIASCGDREPMHEDAVEEILARSVVRVPGPVVERGGRRDLDGVPLRQPLRHEPGVLLATTNDLGAVALHDQQQPPTGHSSPMR